MGVFGDGDNKRKGKARGSTDNASRLAGLGGAKGAAGAADWGEAMPENITAVILGVTRLGGAASFGLSRDKGAYNLTLFLDGERQTLWFNGDAALDEELMKVVIYLDGIS